MVLATVYGDVHDIGKNLVKTILANNGYTVIDLGKQVPAETIITKAVEVKADAIGLSALLVNTSKQMPLIVNELHRRGLNFPVLVGGAAINRRFGWRILCTEDGSLYEPGVFYCKDAFEGLGDDGRPDRPAERGRLCCERLRQEAERRAGAWPARQLPHAASCARRSFHSRSAACISIQLGARAWCARCRWSWSSNTCPRTSCSACPGAPRTPTARNGKRLQAEFEDRLERMQREALRERLAQAAGVYGYWPCQADGDDLVLYDPATSSHAGGAHSSRNRPLHLPAPAGWRPPVPGGLFRPASTLGEMDVVALQVVTVGQEATERFDRCRQTGDYSEAYFLHGLAVQTAEATAEYLHRHIRRELGLPEGQGKRYSWGYPAIPELEDHRKVFDLLPAESELGMSLTSGLPARAGAVHRSDHRPPSGGQVLQRRGEPGGAVDPLNWLADGDKYGATSVCHP